jgi:hypothetical protein
MRVMLGRPTKLTDQVADELVALLASGAPIGIAAATVGVSRRTLSRWLVGPLHVLELDARDIALHFGIKTAANSCASCTGTPTPSSHASACARRSEKRRPRRFR